MLADADVADFVPLIMSIVGLGTGLGGVWLGHSLAGAKSRKQFRRETLERLFATTYAIERWTMDRVVDLARIDLQIADDEVGDRCREEVGIETLLMLVRLYVPELRGQAADVNAAWDAFAESMKGEGIRRAAPLLQNVEAPPATAKSVLESQRELETALERMREAIEKLVP